MKKLIIAISILGLNLGFYCNSNAQNYNIGPKISVGAGTISSKNLQQSFDMRRVNKKDVASWTTDNKFGTAFGIGLMAQYNFTPKLAVVTEPSYNWLTSSFKTDYAEVNTIDGEREVINSEATIKLNYFNLPLLVKYSFLQGPVGVFVMAGVGFDFLSTPTIDSKEDRIKEKYKNGKLESSEIKNNTISTTLDNFASPRTSLILGLGTTLSVAERPLNIDVRYNLPLTASAMYTSDANYHATSFRNNDVFSIYGKDKAELDAPAYPLNDFKMHTVLLSVSFGLLSNK